MLISPLTLPGNLIFSAKGPPILPIELNLAMQHKYNTDIIITGSGVSQWSDQTVNNRHLLQSIDAARPSKESDGGILHDGIAHFMQTLSFTLVQPVTVYILAKYVIYISNRRIFDGLSFNTMTFFAGGGDPNYMLFAGSQAATNGDWPVNTYAAIACVFDGINSSLRVNNNTKTTGDSGLGGVGADGISIGASAVPNNYSNLQIKENLVYTAAHNDSEQTSVINYLTLVNQL